MLDVTRQHSVPSARWEDSSARRTLQHKSAGKSGDDPDSGFLHATYNRCARKKGKLHEDTRPTPGYTRDSADATTDVGPLVWRRQHTFNWLDKRVCQNEDYYVVHVSRFQPTMMDPTEAKLLDRFQWWTVTELSNAVERLTPLSLSQIVMRYLERGTPQEPLEVEVLVD